MMKWLFGKKRRHILREFKRQDLRLRVVKVREFADLCYEYELSARDRFRWKTFGRLKLHELGAIYRLLTEATDYVNTTT